VITTTDLAFGVKALTKEFCSWRKKLPSFSREASHMGAGAMLCPRQEKSDELVRQSARTSLLGPQTALGMPTCSARDAIKKWTQLQHRIDMVNFLLVNHVGRKPRTCLN
jgi:hypothetical protein